MKSFSLAFFKDLIIPEGYDKCILSQLALLPNHIIISEMPHEFVEKYGKPEDYPDIRLYKDIASFWMLGNSDFEWFFDADCMIEQMFRFPEKDGVYFSGREGFLDIWMLGQINKSGFFRDVMAYYDQLPKQYQKIGWIFGFTDKRRSEITLTDIGVNHLAIGSRKGQPQ
jgi:hypothetical protein